MLRSQMLLVPLHLPSLHPQYIHNHVAEQNLKKKQQVLQIVQWRIWRKNGSLFKSLGESTQVSHPEIFGTWGQNHGPMVIHSEMTYFVPSQSYTRSVWWSTFLPVVLEHTRGTGDWLAVAISQRGVC